MKTDPVAFVLTFVGGLMVLVSLFITFYVAGINEGILALISSSLVITVALPLMTAGLVLLGLARIIELLYNNWINIGFSIFFN